MDNKHTSKYYVVEFEKQPVEDYDKYVCVPHSWVHGHDNGNIGFRYPMEKTSVTNRRLIDGEKACEEWPMYLENIKYATDNLAHAKQYRCLMEKSYGKIRRRNSQVNAKSNKTPIPNCTLPNRETRERRNSDYDFDESDEEEFEKLPHSQYKIPEKNKITDDRFKRRASAGGSKDNIDINSPSSSTNTVNDSSAIHTISTSLQALVKEMKRQNDSIEKLHHDYTVNRDACLYSVVLLKEIAKKLSIDTTRLNSNDTVIENRTQTPNQSGMIMNRRRSVRIQEEPSRRDDEETPKRQYIKPFSLPAEYDPKDSRWTLRFRDMAPGLEELKKGTQVYIDSIRFANCKRLARDEKTLARLLLVEIFSQKALGTCSLTGARAKAFDPDGTQTRPGLDERARSVLLNFVEEYCHEKQWVSSERQSIMNSLRNKMQEIRSRFIK